MLQKVHCILKIYLPIIVFCFVSCSESTVNWMEFEEVDKIFSKGDKKGLVLVFDPGCEDCKHAKEYVLTDPAIVSYINEHFYAMQLEILEERTIHFNGRDWPSEVSFQGPKYSTLAKALCQEQDQVPTPTYVFLDEQMNLIVPIKSNVSRKDLIILLKFVGEDKFKEMTIDEFKALNKEE